MVCPDYNLSKWNFRIMQKMTQRFINFILISISALTANICYSATDDIQQLIDLKKTINDVKIVKELNKINTFKIETSQFIKISATYMDYLKQKHPDVFMIIAIADNATDIGYFRIDYLNATSNIQKINLIKNKFNIK